MRELPQKFCEKMQELLGEDYDAYRQSLDQNPHTALRINTNKVSVKTWDAICPFPQEPVAWTEKGRYFDSDQIQPSKHPYYYAGLYYIQEPSAMIPASLLPVQPGDRVLDLCAAPGGKATELAAKLQGKGVLVANDISVSRTMALAKNLQTAGVINAVVTAESPQTLADSFPAYFDAILIDAPCSGEGMFRRDPHMIKDWQSHGPEYYADMQREILQFAYQMLRPGGYLVYSTCTFSPIENEEMIGWFIVEHTDMQICPVERCHGFSQGRQDQMGTYQTEGMQNAVRIFPHLARGEGHFAILLEKAASKKTLPTAESVVRGQAGGHSPARGYSGKKQKTGNGHTMVDPFETAELWLQHAGIVSQGMDVSHRLEVKKSQILLKPEGLKETKGLRMIQSGLIVGSISKARFEPSPQLALAIRDTSSMPSVSFASDDIRVVKYLKGETIESGDINHKEAMETLDHYVLMCVDGFPLGWAKWRKDGRLKNKYYPGWRMV